MKIVEMKPDEVRIYPDGSVVEVYGEAERLVTNPVLIREYKDWLEREKLAQKTFEEKIRR